MEKKASGEGKSSSGDVFFHPLQFPLLTTRPLRHTHTLSLSLSLSLSFSACTREGMASVVIPEQQPDVEFAGRRCAAHRLALA